MVQSWASLGHAVSTASHLSKHWDSRKNIRANRILWHHKRKQTNTRKRIKALTERVQTTWKKEAGKCWNEESWVGKDV